MDGEKHFSWQEAVEREVVISDALDELKDGVRRERFSFPADRDIEPLKRKDGLVAGVLALSQSAREHAREHGTTVQLERAVLEKNDKLAAKNRVWLAERKILALNLVSSPGSGKTTLLERTLHDLRGVLPMSVIEGDQETANDAERIRAAGAPVVQINTGTGCHLEAEMLQDGLNRIGPVADSLVFIENVGNLVCPALFDLGEHAKVAILSVTEGDDKPLKYPHMFRAAQLVIINKTDLLPYVDFDLDRCLEYARRINSEAQVFAVSAARGDGLEAWYDWLRQYRTEEFRTAG